MARKSSSQEPIHLSGITLEGGGQLLRLALSLSSLTHTPIHVSRIRGNRSGGGGLKAQHLTCAQWLASACNARLSGAGLKSKELTFTPTPSSTSSTAASQARKFIEERGNQITITQSTPGSVNLVLQAILPYVLFSGADGQVRVTISGGTNVGNSPSCEYIREVLGPVLECIGVPRIDVQVHSPGWTTGSLRVGSVTYTITPLRTALPAFQLRDRGEITGLKAIVVAPRHTEAEWRDELDVMVEKCSDRLFSNNKGATFDVEFSDSHHEKRYYLLLVAACSTGLRLGRDWLYDIAIRPGKTSQIVPVMVRKVAKDLLGEVEHGGCVDEFMRDQLVVFQALAKGRSQVFGGETDGKHVEVSLHAKTAMWVSKEVVGVEFDEIVGCEGVGFEPCGTENGEEVSVHEVVKDMSELNVKE